MYTGHGTNVMIINTYLVGVSSSKIDGDESQPYDTRCIHSKSNKLRFIEILRDFSSFYCVDRADRDQDHIVELGE